MAKFESILYKAEPVPERSDDTCRLARQKAKL